MGESFRPLYFEAIRRLLKPRARALIEPITIDDARFERCRASSDFIRETIFPGGMLPNPEPRTPSASFAPPDATPVFAFGRDYTHTLRLRRAAFEQQIDQTYAQGFAEAFIRIWRLYYAYCEAAFDADSNVKSRPRDTARSKKTA